ncbi:bifunctional 2-C-methyl-D-erythritol 4-phosphate cytidylyltransferase/2-C-methyl-D-erythritol 2,4-cyclodiphosphate synthase [Qipengyuania sp. JC766]|uniref:bifunctional 2-C-methyl-D-erythritol 4-phosphate cytidylyltransferase/2-C-methyl-D-erythritol 2,4-cyclodiphosphate synthase n=1 Tax=Qipengyuania sp. JC766 TaxID=3232139 RepID=UPI00345905DA
MPTAPIRSNFAAVIVAGGEGSRAGLGIPKQLAVWRGKPVLLHSVERLAKAGAKPIAIVVPERLTREIEAILSGQDGVVLAVAGTTRQGSVRNGLEAIADFEPDSVLIHDAARPIIPDEVLERLLSSLETGEAAIPVLPVVDSLCIERSGRMEAKADRDVLRRVQTPQAFAFVSILDAHRTWKGEPTAGDDAQVAMAAGMKVDLVEGDETLKKLTFREDFMTTQPSARIGTGYDVHRLVEGEDLWLGGVKIAHSHGLSGHSDADVVLHALVDAILGALTEGDIGTHFPPSDEKWRGASSDRFVTHAIGLMEGRGYRIGNADLTIICEAPKIGPHRDAIRDKITGLLGCELDQVSVKATTTEGLGPMGRREGIAAQATVMLLKD